MKPDKQAQLQAALEDMWAFANRLVEKHAMNGDDTMTDDEHQHWQRAAGKASAVLAVNGLYLPRVQASDAELIAAMEEL